MCDVINGFLKAAGWGTAAAAAGVAGAGLFGAGVYMGAKAQRKITRAVIGNALAPSGVPANVPVEPKAEEPMKTAGVPWKLVGMGGLVAGGAVAGAKAQKALGRGSILESDAYRTQVRQKQLQRQGSFAV